MSQPALPQSQSIAGLLAARVQKVHRQLAKWLNSKTAAWKPCTVKVSFIAFCLTAGICSASVVVNSIRHPTDPAKQFTKSPQLSAHRPISSTDAFTLKQYLLKEEYNGLEQFKRYMDSIGKSPEGKAIKDSLLRERPGLMDSLQHVEQLYNDQN